MDPAATAPAGMRDLSVSDSRSDSSSSPPPQTTWPPMGSDAINFGGMMFPYSSQLNPASSALPTSSNPFDPQQYQSIYQNSQLYNSWAYSTAYGFPTAYQGMYSNDFKDFKDFKDVTLTTTAGSSAASTPSASAPLPWTISHEGKKKRQPYKKDQISRLEYEYSVNSYLTNKRRSELSNQLMLDEKQVKVWFQNRRMKDKKIRQRVSGPFPHGAPITPCMEQLLN